MAEKTNTTSEAGLFAPQAWPAAHFDETKRRNGGPRPQPPGFFKRPMNSRKASRNIRLYQF
jgi:hypothetical protein